MKTYMETFQNRYLTFTLAATAVLYAGLFSAAVKAVILSLKI
jgi:hypothetical protein